MMRTISNGIIATSLFLAAGCGVGADVAEGVDEAESPANIKKLQYEAVDITTPPAGQDGWFTVGPSDKAEVYGTGFDCDDEYLVCAFTLFKRQTSGAFVLLQQNFSGSGVNGNGDVGGCVITDNASFFGQAAMIPGRIRSRTPVTYGSSSYCSSVGCPWSQTIRSNGSTSAPWASLNHG